MKNDELKSIMFSNNEMEILKAILDYVRDENRFVAALDDADLSTDDDRYVYEGILRKVYKA